MQKLHNFSTLQQNMNKYSISLQNQLFCTQIQQTLFANVSR